jgi:hypothetical protein
MGDWWSEKRGADGGFCLCSGEFDGSRGRTLPAGGSQGIRSRDFERVGTSRFVKIEIFLGFIKTLNKEQ